jgi:hypothetical protein
MYITDLVGLSSLCTVVGFWVGLAQGVGVTNDMYTDIYYYYNRATLFTLHLQPISVHV